MAKGLKPPDELPSKAWLMSFGDTMTTLLAFFIVLVSLAEDQTGANLHAGTGSFVRTLATAGAAGLFPGDKSQNPIQQEATSPLYQLQDDVGAEDENDIPSKDRELESFSRFINEMDRVSSVEKGSTVFGETTFDFFQKIPSSPPYLPSNFGEIAIRIFPVLRKPDYHVELVVWSPTPSVSAMTRSTQIATQMRSHLLQNFALPKGAENRILGVARTWPSAEERRPVLSVTIARVR